MGEATNGVQKPPASLTTRQQLEPAPPSAAPAVDNVGTTKDDAGKNDATEKQPEQGTEIPEVAGATQAPVEEKPTHGTNPSSPATPPETPERSVQPPQPTEHAHADEAAPDVDAVKADDCTTPPPPAHDSEGSDTQSADGHGSPCREKPKPAGAVTGGKRDVAASKSRLLAFRSFSRDKKVKKLGDETPPEAGRMPSPGEHQPAHGKAGEEGAEHKGREKGKERRKMFWK